MKSIIAALLLTSLVGFNQSVNIKSDEDLLSLKDAEKIFGESGKKTESITESKDNLKIHKTAYRADAKDPKSGREVNLYFMYEEYKYDSAAKRVYNEIKTGNQTHEGFQVWKGIGDEAYYHTDGTNFYFVLARKGPKMIRMKLNKVTSKSSEAEFKKISEKIVSKL